jgi:erythromycin esterase
MAENLIWLGDQEFPGSRIAAWGHWRHFARNLEGIEILDDSRSYAGEHPMGEHVAEALGREAYSVGFLAFEGEHGQIFPDTAFIIPIPEPPVGSLDWLLGQLGEPYLFLDLGPASPMAHRIRRNHIHICDVPQ